MKVLRHSLRWAALACLLAAAGALAQSGSGATIYKWVDEKGVTHYSENPPPPGGAQPVEIAPPPAAADRQEGKSLQQQETEFLQRQRAREAQERLDEFNRRVKAMNEKMHAQACTDARARLAALQANRRAPMYRRDPATGQMVADFEIRGMEIERLGKAIDENCPPE